MSKIETSPHGVHFLRDPAAVVVAQPSVDLTAAASFLEGFSGGEFAAYLDDNSASDPGTELAKFAGQLCYLSFGPNRTYNAEAQKYMNNVLSQAHGSILEHVAYSILFYGIDRAVTHELVRHRAGMAYSQVSQRYVDKETLRYVMPFKVSGVPAGEKMFFEDIEANVRNYERRVAYLMETEPTLDGESPRDKRKRVNSFARRVLANEVEAPILVTGNVRAWRHVFEMRLSPHADVEIRRAIYEAYKTLRGLNRTAFEDFVEVQLPDGSMSAVPKYKKV